MSRDEAAFVMAQALSATPPTADRPADYEITPDGVMRALDTWKRDDRATFLRMMLEATNNVTASEVFSWTDEQVKQADCWAFSTHLSASDHDDVQVPERPSFIGYRTFTHEQGSRLLIGIGGLAACMTAATAGALHAWGML